MFSCPVVGLFNLQSLTNENTFKFATISRHKLTHIPGSLLEVNDLEQFIYTSSLTHFCFLKMQVKISISCVSVSFENVNACSLPNKNLTHYICSVDIDIFQIDIAIQGSEFPGWCFHVGAVCVWRSLG